MTCNGRNNKANTIFGTPGNDVIHGLGGNDVICGGPGNDRLFGDQGEDQLFGESGNDILKEAQATTGCSGRPTTTPWTAKGVTTNATEAAEPIRPRAANKPAACRNAEIGSKLGPGPPMLAIVLKPLPEGSSYLGLSLPGRHDGTSKVSYTKRREPSG